MDREAITDFFKRIDLAREGCDTFYDLYKRMASSDFEKGVGRAREALYISDKAFGEEISAFAECEKIRVEELNLFLFIYFAFDTLEEYIKRGICDDIFYATFLDITIVCRVCMQKNGIYGIPQDVYREWLRELLLCKIYRLGRLEFEISESKYDLPEYGIKVGDACIYTHIPRYEPLELEACEASYDAARSFFRVFYGIEHCVFFCDSWLLHPWLREDLPANSRIRMFSEKYSLLEVNESREAVLNWVFPFMEHLSISELPQDTYLRRAAVKRMMNGKPIGEAVGVRL